ncbi:MAG: hypothetical protein A2W91_20475 [Bacteroidetes bacterium GWF2_38_335]|nr:MAG: hypothetical protein A2W91_20475 [Bacteroidetes bacterium GWF2_38_335]OFY79468.1 MAG: hypothetical protein A2281_13610 [Bacteroidetes bacterium RIFOXYA12_FULL_38_20]HBS86596.1 hypothetical protein [Bacteroidales bacterium]
MKAKYFFFALFPVVLFSLVFSGCKKEEDEESEYSDKLALGTGMSGFDLVGEGTTFTQTSGSVIIYFRLESEADMAGRPVVLDFLTSGGSLINTITRDQAQDYGHIMLSSFEWLGGTGNFKINAYLSEGSEKTFVATINFTVN